MSRATPDDQLKFLLSCVKFSNGGKIDFVEVARECGVVSKGAAAKRYERLLKANGIHPGGGPTTEKTSSHPPQRTKKFTKAGAGQKRKRDESSPEMCKREAGDEVKQRPPKQESLDMPFMQEPPPGFRPPPYGHMMHPQPPFMHRQMPPFLPPNMGPNIGPPQHQMISPPPTPYGMMLGLPPGGHFIMPHQHMPPFHMPQTMSPPPVHDPHINLNAFEDFYCPELFSDNNLDPLLLGDSASETKIPDISVPQPPSSEPVQTMPPETPNTSDQVKVESCQAKILPLAAFNSAPKNVKVEAGALADQERVCSKSTMVCKSSDASQPGIAVSTSTPMPNDRQPAAKPTEVQSKVNWHECSKEDDDCIFIS